MHLGTGILVLVFIVAALLIGALTRHVLKKLHLPYTVVLLLIGLLVGAADRVWDFEHSAPVINDMVHILANVDPHLILFIFLPTLIFESAYSLEVHLFRRLLNQIAILAIPGLIICSLISAAVSKAIVPFEWSWPIALMFGALISATDPVAVVALLKEVSSRKRLETLLEGESLLNDGTAIVLFTIFFGLVISQLDGATDTQLSIAGLSLEFVWVVLAGLFVGLTIGWLALAWIDRIFNDPLIEIAITIASAYLVYFVAEVLLHVSGVVALVAMALLFAGVGRTRISPEVSEFVHQFWEVMAYIANTLIFILVGVLIASRLNFAYMQLAAYVLVLYVALLIIRGGTITMLMPILTRVGGGINREKAIVLTWGGLRGAVSLALALTVAQSESIPVEIRDQILFLCACIVVLTIVVNGSTMTWVFRKLKLDQLPPAKQATVEKAEASIEEELYNLMPNLEQNDFLKGADWVSIRKKLGLEVEKKPIDSDVNIQESDLSVAFRRRLLETERQNYWLQFNEGMIGRHSTQHLVESAEHALDGEPTIYPRTELQKMWEVPVILRYLKRIPLLNRWAVHMSFRRMTLGYDMARGFISAQNEVESYIDQLAPSKTEAEAAHREISLNKQDTYSRVDELRQSFPEIINTLETNAAIRLMLNTERAVIRRLLEHAVLDKSEAGKLLHDVEQRMVAMQRSPDQASLPDPTKIIEQAAWVKGLAHPTIKKLIKIAEHRIFTSGEAIFRQGERSGSFAIIIRGQATIQQIQADGSTTEKLAGPGEIVGARAIMTGIADCSATAKVPIDALWMSEEKLKPVMASDPQLVSNLLQYLTQDEH